MGRQAGGIRGTSVKNRPVADIQTVKKSFLDYAKEDRRNRNTVYSMGFNEDAQSVIDEVAAKNLGFAS